MSLFGGPTSYSQNICSECGNDVSVYSHSLSCSKNSALGLSSSQYQQLTRMSQINTGVPYTNYTKPKYWLSIFTTDGQTIRIRSDNFGKDVDVFYCYDLDNNNKFTRFRWDFINYVEQEEC